jgi:DcuC family C4-dicarboxylate transporter
MPSAWARHSYGPWAACPGRWPRWPAASTGGWLSGSGSGPVLAFAQTVLVPLGIRPCTAALGALTCLAAAFGLTMSPVSAVICYGAGSVGVAPLALVRRLLPALLAGAIVALTTELMRVE